MKNKYVAANYDKNIHANVFLVLFVSLFLVDFLTIIYFNAIPQEGLMVHFGLTIFWHALTCMVLTLPVIFLKRTKKIYQLLLFIIFLPFGFIEYLHLVIYKVPFHESSYITISAFNEDIAADFFYAYFHWYHFGYMLVYVLIFVLLYRLKIHFRKPSILTLIFLFVVSSPFIYRFNKAYIKSIPTFRMISVWMDYRENCEKLSQHTDYDLSKMQVKKKFQLQKELHIIVIGESTSATHLELYGYKRKTNPKLSEIKNELILVEQVFTDKVHTIESLLDIFTFGLNEKKRSTLIDVFNAAGYQTFWLSNQPFFEKSSTPITLVSKRASKSKFINPINSDITDLTLLKSFDSLVKNLSVSKQIIFVHLRGTHTPYFKDYPVDFNQFKGGKSAFGKEAAEIINQYDNAVLFNDYILSKMIDIVQSKEEYNVSFTYFSDHGDEVYDHRDYFGHNQAMLPSIQMTHVPCFIWLNDKMKTNNLRVIKPLNKKFKLKYLANTLVDLYSIEFDLLPKKFSFLR